MRKILIVIDMQNDFIDGALGTKEAEAIVPAVVRKIKSYPADDVYATRDTHPENYLDTQEGRRLPVPHCIKGSDGWRLYGRVEALRHKQDICFYKNALGSRELLRYLEEHPVEEMELCGLVSNMCVLSNAIVAKAALPECRVTVNERLTRSFDEKLHAEAMDVLRGVQIDVI